MAPDNAPLGLNFVALFALVRFGLRDRFTRLALALFLVALPIESHRFLVVLPVEILAAIVALVALCLREWHRPMMVLALVLGPRVAFFEAIQYSVCNHGHRMLFSVFGHRLDYFALELGVTAVLCMWLHRRLLGERTATGGAYA